MTTFEDLASPSTSPPNDVFLQLKPTPSLGPTTSPMDESDPRHGIEPNFYFPQIDLLTSWTAHNKSQHVITIPGFILGATTTAAMNILYPLSIYAAIQSHLSLALDFPADPGAYVAEKHQSSATLLSHHAEWALLTPATGNQLLNSCDSSAFSWGKLWPTLASHYDLRAGTPAPASSRAYRPVTLAHDPPPLSFGGAGTIHSTFTFLEWSQRRQVRAAWAELAAHHQLQGSAFEHAEDTFGLLDAEILGPWGRVLSMNKNRRLGWHGFVDTRESIEEVIREMARLRLVPPMPVKEVGGSLGDTRNAGQAGTV